MDDIYKYERVSDRTLWTLDKFDKNRLREQYFRMLIFGTSYSGKSYYVGQLYNEVLKLHYVPFIFTKQENITSYLKMKIPIQNIFTEKLEFESKIDKLYSFQRKNILKFDKDGEPKYKYNLLFVFDDILDEKMRKNSPEWWNNLWAVSRHSGISSIFLIQDIYHFCSSTMWNNATFLIACRMNSTENRGKVLGKIRNYIDQEDILTIEEKTEIAKKIYKLYIYNKDFGKIIFDFGRNQKILTFDE